MKIRTLAAALACSVCVVAIATPAQAQQRAFDIPAGSLRTALDAYGRQAGRPIIYRAEEIRGARSPGYRGSSTPEAALNTILTGTGFAARTDNSGAVAIVRIGATQGEAVAGSAAAENGRAEQDEAVVVTGSRLRSAPSSSPIQTITRTEIDRSGYQTAGEALRALPQNFGGGQQAAVIGVPGPGSSQNFSFSDSANLRGFGSESTLVLINGQRLPFTGKNGSQSISGIPIAAVERVDVLTESASAIYGSDAVGGVVNFVLRQNFSGAESSGSIGFTDEGGGFEHRLAQLAGASWGSGNVLINYQHYERERLGAEQRSFSTSLARVNDLVPQLNTDSVFLTGRQHFGRFTLSSMFLYADNDTTYQTAQNNTQFVARSSSSQFVASGRLEYDLNNRWTFGVSANWGRDRLRYRVDRAGSTIPTLTNIDNDFLILEGDAKGTILDLPGGPVPVVFGGGTRRESLFYPVIPIDADQRVNYLFAEVSVPIFGPSQGISGFNRLELNLAARYEDYDTLGSSFNPKIGLAYSPLEGLIIRGSYSRAFRTPTLEQTNGLRQLLLWNLADPAAPGGTTVTLIRFGSNPDLEPETANSWTAGFDFRPRFVPGLAVHLTYFRTNYRQRISALINPLASSLTNPLFAPLITRAPTVALLNEILATGGTLIRINTPGIDPTTAGAVADARVGNLATQLASGVDLGGTYQTSLGANASLTVNANASWLKLNRQILPSTPASEQTGLVFQPPRFRSRIGVTFSRGPVYLNGVWNHTSRWIDNLTLPATRIGRFDTIDAGIGFESQAARGPLSGFALRLSVDNLLNRDPPRLSATTTSTLPGVGYDSTNASPYGRRFLISASKRW